MTRTKTMTGALAASTGALALLLGATGAGAGNAAALGSDMPSWSPDGHTVAFAGFRKGQPGDIYTADIYGGRERRLTATSAHEDMPRWAPDGRRIAFVRTVRFVRQLFVMNADGSGERQLTFDPLPSFAPSWSPDGRRLAFARGREGEGANDSLRVDAEDGAVPAGSPLPPADVYVLDLDGGGERRLTYGPSIDTSPAWSPLGDLIAFTSNRNLAGAQQLFVMRPDGSEQRKLTAHPVLFHTEQRPAWSPDGSTIAFVADNRHPPLGNSTIYLVDADGTNQRRLTWYPGNDDWPAWSPDGQLAIARGQTAFRPEIYVLGPSGGLGARKITGVYLSFAGLTMSPAAPWRARPFAVELRVKPGIDPYTDTRCEATLGDQLLTDPLTSRAGGRLRCVWNLPGYAQGKLLRGVIGVKRGGSEVTRAFAVRVR